MADIQSVLRPLEQFETLLQEVYTVLGERFAADAEAAALFGKLSFEERSHVGQVQFLRRLARRNPSHFAEVPVDLEAINRELQQLENVRGAVGQLSLHEAVVLASEFESGVAELHSRPAIAKSNPEVASMLRGLRDADLRHYTALVEFAQKRGFRSA
jgi:rubrerythrin